MNDWRRLSQGPRDSCVRSARRARNRGKIEKQALSGPLYLKVGVSGLDLSVYFEQELLLLPAGRGAGRRDAVAAVVSAATTADVGRARPHGSGPAAFGGTFRSNRETRPPQKEWQTHGGRSQKVLNLRTHPSLPSRLEPWVSRRGSAVERGTPHTSGNKQWLAIFFLVSEALNAPAHGRQMAWLAGAATLANSGEPTRPVCI